MPSRARTLVLATVATLASIAAAPVDPVEEFVARHWRAPLAPQGPPPARYSPLEASLAPDACGRCHAAQYADWRSSVHAAAMGPGVAGQLAELLARDPPGALACQTCHAPLAEQAPLSRRDGALVANPAYEPNLQARGVVCAACHVRGHERFAPPTRDGSLASAAPRASLPHDGATRTPAFLRSEFCRDCHQFAANGLSLNGKLVQNTYEEWRASRFARDGVQCQDCHMPERRHLWRGIHDVAMVRGALDVDIVVADDVLRLRVTSARVGHAFPTYVTPLVVLRGDTLDADGRVVPGARAERVIGRRVTLDLARELEDTRLAPGESAVLAYARPEAPRGARLTVVVYPDAFYTEFFEALLRQGAGRGEAQIREALAATRRSPYVVFERVVPGR